MDVFEPSLDKEWLVAHFLPVRAVYDDASAGAPIAARQDYRAKTLIAKSLCEGNHNRRFAGSTDSEVPDADDRMIQPKGRQDSGPIKFFAGMDQESESGAHRRASIGWKNLRTRSVAPVFEAATS